jgi:hypothetical protein
MKRIAQFLGCIALVLSAGIPAVAQEATPPNAVDDQAETDGKTIHIYVLQNDSAPGGSLDPSTLTIVLAPTRGEAVVIAQGSPKIKYTAIETADGVDSFRYQICDSNGSCATATVTVNISLSETTTTSTTTTTITTTSTTLPPAGSVEQPPSGGSDSAGTPVTTESTPSTVPATNDPAPRVHPLGEMMLGSHEVIVAAGTTIGEPRGFQFEEDIRYLGRSGRDTLKLIAVPTLMVSGIVGFLMIGLPQNAFGAVLGFLFGLGRWKKKTDAVADPDIGSSPERESETGAIDRS